MGREAQLSLYPTKKQKQELESIKGMVPKSFGTSNTDVVWHALELAKRYLNNEISFADPEKEKLFAAKGNCFPFLKRMQGELKVEEENVTNFIQDEQIGKSTSLEDVDGREYSSF